ncbi:ATP-binding protein [Vibrio europaeus]|uniref:ATP-binding protein n=1 Tax=Vibrio europaeus TaxID=300876 RepID=UPI002340BC26|nr:ATP-binding protein [Vibrio europaeus]MDC5848183.1 ATP-binding protein [Vibrio europaeus]
MNNPILVDAPQDDPMLNIPDPSRLIHGLRDTGYDFNTASADIIDNSIAAGATNINIRIELAITGHKFVYFGDNGHGMDEEGLRNAMRYGAKIRENLSSLGKFGLGLKTASSSVCLKYSLISRSNETEPLRKLTWDLEYVSQQNSWKMLEEAISEDEEEMFEELCGDSGTLVVWSKCDRLLSKVYDEPGGTKEKAAVNYRRDKLIDHCALIFHKYLNPEDEQYQNINININDIKVEHWNPFYPERSEQVLPERMTKLAIQCEDGSTHNATVKAWILPHSKDMTQAENKSNAKLSNRGQGFYIHREGRIIHSGGYLGIWRADDPHWSLLRVEFDFDHNLDEAFRVDVKKSRIILDPALEEALKNLLGDAYREADRRYRRKQANKVSTGISHNDSNNTIGDTKNTSKADVNSADIDSNTAVVTNNLGSGITIFTPVENNVSPDKLYVNPVDGLPNGALWEPCLTSATDDNHSTGIHLNKQHDFYTKIYSQAKSGASIEGLDLLLWAMGAAEHKNTDKELSAMWEDIREEVSSNLRKLLRSTDLPS